MDRDELTRREAGAWDAFLAVVDRVPASDLERPGVNVEGWTVKDLLWHVAYWWDDLTDTLDRVRVGTFEEPIDEDGTDEENAQVLDASRRLPADEVRSGLDAARARMLASWAALPAVDVVAAKHFLWETIEHYEEHEPDLRRFVEGSGLSD
ncbi:MAG TPA: DinB family protein [Actinomycetota bacterium]|jgi:hypothetical protein|nr:DinB family protein [Actinomycetota bacterium]